MSERLYGLTSDEWFQIACCGEDSEVSPCCGNIGAIRDLTRELMVFQSPDEIGWRKIIGERLIVTLDADDNGHNLESPGEFPLFNRMIKGLREELK